MPKYMVALWETEGGRVYLEADNAKEAEERVFNALEEHGIDGLPKRWYFDPTHREYQVVEVEECK
jgi:hypothetical protein